MLQDFRFALRLIAKERWYTAVAVLALSLGIGVNATVFAIVDAALFRALPFKDPGRLYVLDWEVRSGARPSVSYAELQDWREALAGVPMVDAAVQDPGKPYWIIFRVDYSVLAYVSAICLVTGILFGLAPALHVSRGNLNSVLRPAHTVHSGRLCSGSTHGDLAHHRRYQPLHSPQWPARHGAERGDVPGLQAGTTGGRVTAG